MSQSPETLLTALRATPPLVIKVPASTKNGSANKGSTCMVWKNFCASESKLWSAKISKVKMLEKPSATAIGTPISKQVNRTVTRNSAFIPAYPQIFFSPGLYPLAKLNPS